MNLSNSFKITGLVMSCLMSFILVCFSIEELIRVDESTSRQIYLALLTSVVSIWIPSPINTLGFLPVQVEPVGPVVDLEMS